jgi:aryl-alcohol dehydrogenase-like predicted oxidoreductase
MSIRQFYVSRLVNVTYHIVYNLLTNFVGRNSSRSLDVSALTTSRLPKNHKPNPLRLDTLRASIDNINSKLEGTKRVDIFESARVDPSRPIEEVITDMRILVEEGKFEHIGLSECSAETLRRANAVHPIASVEIEVSPWSYEEETKKGAFLSLFTCIICCLTSI